MNRLFLLSGLLISIAGVGAQASPVASPTLKAAPGADDFRSAGGASDMLGSKAPPPAPTPTQESNRISIRCTNEEGYVLSEGEGGYDTCLAKRREKLAPAATKKTY